MVRVICNGKLLDVDGDYGKNTFLASLAVWKFVTNRKLGLKLTYINHNFGDECKAAAARLPVGLRVNGTYVFIYEAILMKLGFYSGNMDGDFGNAMLDATKKYQEKNGLTVDGVIGGGCSYSMFNNPAFSSYH